MAELHPWRPATGPTPCPEQPAPCSSTPSASSGARPRPSLELSSLTASRSALAGQALVRGVRACGPNGARRRRMAAFPAGAVSGETAAIDPERDALIVTERSRGLPVDPSIPLMIRTSVLPSLTLCWWRRRFRPNASAVNQASSGLGEKNESRSCDLVKLP